MATERIVIHLPLPVEIVGVIGEAIGARWPDAKMVTSHGLGPGKLVIELDLYATSDAEDEDDEEDGIDLRD